MNDNEKEAIERTAVLVVATLVFSRLLASLPAFSPESARREATNAFAAAEAFRDEAKARGYDAEAIAKLAEGLT